MTVCSHSRSQIYFFRKENSGSVQSIATKRVYNVYKIFFKDIVNVLIHLEMPLVEKWNLGRFSRAVYFSLLHKIFCYLVRLYARARVSMWGSDMPTPRDSAWIVAVWGLFHSQATFWVLSLIIGHLPLYKNRKLILELTHTSHAFKYEF